MPRRSKLAATDQREYQETAPLATCGVSQRAALPPDVQHLAESSSFVAGLLIVVHVAFANSPSVRFGLVGLGQSAPFRGARNPLGAMGGSLLNSGSTHPPGEWNDPCGAREGVYL